MTNDFDEEVQHMPEMTDAYQWQGRTIVGSDGEKAITDGLADITEGT